MNNKIPPNSVTCQLPEAGIRIPSNIAFCELLVLFDYDFREILGPYMTKAWDDKKQALKALDYFEFLDKEQIVEACRLGTLKQYSPLETMYCDDAGSLTNVHFVLSGECLILQCLKMTVTMKKGRRDFKLMPAEDDDTLKMLRQGVKSEHSTTSNQRDETVSRTEINRLVANTSSSDNDPNAAKHLMRKMNLIDIERLCGETANKVLTPTFSLFAGRRFPRKSVMSRFSDKDQNSIEDEDFVEDYWGNWTDDYEDEAEDNDKEDSKNNDKVDAENEKLNLEITTPFPTSRLKLHGSEKSSLSLNLTLSSSSSRDGSTLPVVDSRFIDVGSITFGGIFGLGEQMQHRVIMARTTVQCLILPRFFLLENKQNPGNIWERRLFYLECMIPSREALFKEFLKTRKWKKFKNDVIRQTLNSSDNHGTHIEDIPIMCRIVESADDDIHFSK